MFFYTLLAFASEGVFRTNVAESYLMEKKLCQCNGQMLPFCYIIYILVLYNRILEVVY